MISLKLLCYSTITLCFNGAVLRRYMREDLRLAFPYTFLVLLPTVTQPLCQLLLGGFCGVTVFAIACYYLFRNLPQQYRDARGKAVFITGCESGLAHSAAAYLDSLGFHVYAAFLTEDAKVEKELAQLCSERLVTLYLDPSDDNRVTSAVEDLQENLNGRELWGVVNAVSCCYYAELEIMPMDFYKKLWSVNVEGQIRITRALLPLMRRSQGRLVNVTGISGRLPAPGFSAFCASKAAFLMYSDVLRMEMAKWNVNVSVIEHSEYRAAFNQECRLKKALLHMKQEVSPLVAHDYGDQYFTAAIASVEREDENDFHPDQTRACRAIEHALLAAQPHEHYTCDKTGTLISILTSHVPAFITDVVANVLSGANIPAKHIAMLARDGVSGSPKHEPGHGAGEKIRDDVQNDNVRLRSTKNTSNDLNVNNIPIVASE